MHLNGNQGAIDFNVKNHKNGDATILEPPSTPNQH